MNFSSLIQSVIAMAKPMLGIFGAQSHSVIERWVTIPAKDRAKLYVGLSMDEQAEADRLMRVMADAISDFTVYVASRGEVGAD
jgi:hypothetical protein